jgi:hypothetical protein
MSRPWARSLPRLAVCAFLAWALVPAAADAAAPLPLGDYRARLGAIERQLTGGDWPGARDAARGLAGERVRYGREEIRPDLSVLEPLARARSRQEAAATLPGLRRLLAFLPAREAPTEGSAAAPRLLEDARRRQALPEIGRGGVMPRVDRLPSLRQALAELLEPPLRAFSEAFERFWSWLQRLLPDPRRLSRSGWGLHDTVIALVVAGAVAFSLLALRAWRRRRRGGPPSAAAASAPPPSRDDDPLSRETSEWERYAAELAAAGRAREAIRAWYHAVLAALYRSGQLHYRKGRTNWEYAAALPPSLPWRATFFEITHRFEREWYGGSASSIEALDRARSLALGLLGAVRGARP